jgi:hypothetical protein
VQQYESQLTTLAYLMSTFVRQNEPFAKPQPALLERLQKGESTAPHTWRDDLGQAIKPVQRDPNRDFITREMVGVTDLEALYAARDQDNRLLLCARLGSRRPFYLLTGHRISPSGITHHTASNHNFRRMA